MEGDGGRDGRREEGRESLSFIVVRVSVSVRVSCSFLACDCICECVSLCPSHPIGPAGVAGMFPRIGGYIDLEKERSINWRWTARQPVRGHRARIDRCVGSPKLKAYRMKRRYTKSSKTWAFLYADAYAQARTYPTKRARIRAGASGTLLAVLEQEQKTNNLESEVRLVAQNSFLCTIHLRP